MLLDIPSTQPCDKVLTNLPRTNSLPGPPSNFKIMVPEMASSPLMRFTKLKISQIQNSFDFSLIKGNAFIKHKFCLITTAHQLNDESKLNEEEIKWTMKIAKLVCMPKADRIVYINLHHAKILFKSI